MTGVHQGRIIRVSRKKSSSKDTDGVPAGLRTLEVAGAQGLVFTAVVETAGAAQMRVDLD